jgi:hypothetical protein
MAFVDNDTAGSLNWSCQYVEIGTFGLSTFRIRSSYRNEAPGRPLPLSPDFPRVNRVEDSTLFTAPRGEP